MYILHKVSIWINCLTVRTESSFESPLTPRGLAKSSLSSLPSPLPPSLFLRYRSRARIEGNKFETLKRGTWKVTSGGLNGKDKRIDNRRKMLSAKLIIRSDDGVLNRVYNVHLLTLLFGNCCWMKSWSKTREFHRSSWPRERNWN